MRTERPSSMWRTAAITLGLVALGGCGGGDDGPPPPPTLSSIAVTPANPTATTLTGTQQFTATATFSDGSTQNVTSTANWTSSATGIATLGNAGLATTAGAGTTTITATLSGVSGSTTLTVAPASLSWDQAGWNTVYWQ